jgi:hypothetical protein
MTHLHRKFDFEFDFEFEGGPAFPPLEGWELFSYAAEIYGRMNAAPGLCFEVFGNLASAALVLLAVALA